MTTTMTIEEAGLLLADPLSYTDEERLHRGLALLRREAPVHLVTAPGYRPFYAVTRHADIMEVERDGALWLSEPRPALAPLASERANAGFRVRTLVNMDDPDHRVVRAIGADWFRPRASGSGDPATPLSSPSPTSSGHPGRPGGTACRYRSSARAAARGPARRCC
jgi:cytochrome P450